MQLLGTGLLALLAVLTVLFPVLTVWLWSRVRGPRTGRVAARGGLIVASQLAAVLLVAAAANDYGYFYGSWTGLWGGIDQLMTGAAPGEQVVVRGDGHTPGDPVVPGSVRAVPDAWFSTPAEWKTRGRLETVDIEGPITQLHGMGFVYLPPQYFQKRYAHTEFPAVEAFNGYPGTYEQLVTKLQYQKALLRDLHRHAVRPMVLVMMHPSLTFARDLECTDVPGGPQVETFFAQDVPTEISQNYHVNPVGWGAIGDSTGGYCAAKITMLNPYAFHAAVALSGFFTAIHDNTTGSLWGGSRVVRHLNSLIWRLQHLPAPPVSLLVTTSRDEGGPLGISNSRRFLAAARPPMKVDSIIEPHGGHNFTTWEPELPEAFSWLSVRLPSVAPA